MYILVHVVLYMEWTGLFLHIFITKAQNSCAADQHLCFQYTNSTIPLLPESHFFSASRAKKEVCYIVINHILNFNLFLLSILFSVKDFIQRKIDYSEYPFHTVQRKNLQLLGRTMVKKIMYQTLNQMNL